MIDQAGNDTPANKLHDGSIDKLTVAHSQAQYQLKTPLGRSKTLGDSFYNSCFKSAIVGVGGYRARSN